MVGFFLSKNTCSMKKYFKVQFIEKQNMFYNGR